MIFKTNKTKLEIEQYSILLNEVKLISSKIHFNTERNTIGNGEELITVTCPASTIRLYERFSSILPKLSKDEVNLLNRVNSECLAIIQYKTNQSNTESILVCELENGLSDLLLIEVGFSTDSSIFDFDLRTEPIVTSYEILSFRVYDKYNLLNIINEYCLNKGIIFSDNLNAITNLLNEESDLLNTNLKQQ
jgi:hypothetical protein